MTAGDSESAPIDFEVLYRVYSRLQGDERFEEVKLRPDYAPNSLVPRYDLRYFPSFVVANYLQILVYERRLQHPLRGRVREG